MRVTKLRLRWRLAYWLADLARRVCPCNGHVKPRRRDQDWHDSP